MECGSPQAARNFRDHPSFPALPFESSEEGKPAGGENTVPFVSREDPRVSRCTAVRGDPADA